MAFLAAGALSISRMEAICWEAAQAPWSDLLGRLRSIDEPPLYVACLKVWIQMFGDSLPLMRLLSGIWFGGLLLASLFFCREAAFGSGSTPVGNKELTPWQDLKQATLLLVAACPILFRYSQEAQKDIMAAALIVLSSALLLHVIRRSGQLPPFALYLVAAGALLCTHKLGLLCVASQYSYVLAVWAYARYSSQASGGALALCRIVAFGLLITLYTGWFFSSSPGSMPLFRWA